MKPKGKIHAGDALDTEERVQKAINLEKPDRVPVAPLIYYFNAPYNNMTFADLRDPRKYYNGLVKMFEDLGPWDANYFINFYHKELVSFGIPMRVLEPGEELPPDVPRQFTEEEVMEPEDYDWIIDIGGDWPPLLSYSAYFRWFMERLLPDLWDHIPRGWKSYPLIMPKLIMYLYILNREFAGWRKRGVTTLYPIPLEAAFDNFSLSRGVIGFAKDLKYRPEKIRAAAEALTDSYVLMIKFACLISGIKRAEVFVHRSSNDFISPKQFRELSLPSLKALLERLADAGIASVLHCDGCWDLNLEAMRELPRKKVVMQCDGRTDVFRAKEVLGDHLCIYGDVPSDLLAFGSVSQVDEYCHRLIEEVGKGGGFILGSGCEVPSNAKPENVRAMCESVVKYGYYD